MRKILECIGFFLFFLKKSFNYFIKTYQKGLLLQCGKSVHIGNNCKFTEKTISIGNNVFIGDNCCFKSAHGTICIGHHVMFGPGVHIHGGNHDIDKIGFYMMELTSKEPRSDGQVLIEDDCWIGANAMIFKGVRIGRGSIIGGGSIVTKDIPPYSIYTGAPSAKLRQRFTESEIIVHEGKLYERHNGL